LSEVIRAPCEAILEPSTGRDWKKFLAIRLDLPLESRLTKTGVGVGKLGPQSNLFIQSRA